MGTFAVGIPSSLLPLPKPLITGPSMRNGNGGSGPEVGPIEEIGRGAPLLSLAADGVVGWVVLVEPGSVPVAMVTFVIELNTNYIVVVLCS